MPKTGHRDIDQTFPDSRIPTPHGHYEVQNDFSIREHTGMKRDSYPVGIGVDQNGIFVSPSRFS